MTRDELIEKLARADCRGHGRDPDRCAWGSGGIDCHPDGSMTFTSECHRRQWEDHRGAARAVLAEIDALGLAVVPKEPTQEALVAAMMAFLAEVEEIPRKPDASPFMKGLEIGQTMVTAKMLLAAYRAMLAASEPVTTPEDRHDHDA